MPGGVMLTTSEQKRIEQIDEELRKPGLSAVERRDLTDEKNTILAGSMYSGGSIRKTRRRKSTRRKTSKRMKRR